MLFQFLCFSTFVSFILSLSPHHLYPTIMEAKTILERKGNINNDKSNIVKDQPRLDIIIIRLHAKILFSGLQLALFVNLRPLFSRI